MHTKLIPSQLSPDATFASRQRAKRCHASADKTTSRRPSPAMTFVAPLSLYISRQMLQGTERESEIANSIVSDSRRSFHRARGSKPRSSVTGVIACHFRYRAIGTRNANKQSVSIPFELVNTSSLTRVFGVRDTERRPWTLRRTWINAGQRSICCMNSGGCPPSMAF